MADKANEAIKINVDLVNNAPTAYNNWAKAAGEANTKIDALLQDVLALNKSLKAATSVKSFNEEQRKLKATLSAVSTAEREQIKTTELLAREQQKTAREVLKTTTAQKKAEAQAKQTKTEYQKLSTELTKNRNKAKDLAVQIAQTTIKYGKNSKQVKALQRSYNGLATSVNKTDAQLKKIDANLGQRQRNVGNYTKGIKGLVSAFGVVGGIQLFAKAITNAFNISKKYEKQNAVLASVLGKTRKETVLLQKESKKLGSQTVFTSTQVTELQTELARLGLSEKEIIDSTKGIINATIALGSETGETAALVGATLNAFSLGAKDSAKVADILTLSTQRSALSFDKLNTALPIVAGAASAAGVSLEETVAQLGAAADRGIDASTSATSLRNIYLELSKKGITLNEALNKINKSQDKLTEANNLFGKRAAVTALALAESTDKTNGLASALENAGGTAERVAKEQLNTLDGSLALLNSAWEGFVLNINNSETALGSFTKSVVDFSTKGLTGLSNIDLIFKSIFQDLDNFSDVELQRIIDSADLENGEKLSEVLSKAVDNYEKLPDAAKENITLNQLFFETLVSAGESIDNARVLADFYTSSLNEQSKAATETTKSQKKLSDVNVEVENSTIDLIKKQEDLLKVQNAIIAATEPEVEARNKNIKAINNEISRLKALGEVKAPDKVEGVNIDLNAVEEQYNKLDEFQKEDIENYLEGEEKKTEILKQQAESRANLEKQLIAQVAESAIGIGNALFDNKKQKLEDETEEIAAFYDNKLAAEGLDEEQRAAIGDERDKRLNEQAAKEREIEEKQFLFNQGVKLAEIATATALGVATATAQAPATLGASLGFIPLIIGTGLAQAALVAAQTIPQFDKGSDYTPSTYIAGEKGSEIRIDKSGNASLVTGPTLFTDDKGSKIVSTNDTAKLMDNIGRNQIIENVKEGRNRTEQLMIDAAMQRLGLNNMRGFDKVVSAINNTAQNKSRLDEMRERKIIDKHRA